MGQHQGMPQEDTAALLHLKRVQCQTQFLIRRPKGLHFNGWRKLRELGIIRAYHDRSDGGLFTTMAFAGRAGVDMKVKDHAASIHPQDIRANLFNEELGAVFQVSESNLGAFKNAFRDSEFPKQYLYHIGVVKTRGDQTISINHDGDMIYDCTTRGELQQKWSETSYAMQCLRDNPVCADQEYENILGEDDQRLTYIFSFTRPPPISFSPPSQITNSA